jgi:hypothetical protein
MVHLPVENIIQVYIRRGEYNLLYIFTSQGNVACVLINFNIKRDESVFTPKNK